MDSFPSALTYLLQDEGGFVNDPDGGPTNAGITLSLLSAYLGRQAQVSDLQALTPDQISDVYRAMFWSPNHLNEMTDANIATALLDQIVNRGPKAAIQDFQTVLGPPVIADGIIGPMTLNAANKANAPTLIAAYAQRCEASYRLIVAGDPTQAEFLDGWLNRAQRLNTLEAA